MKHLFSYYAQTFVLKFTCLLLCIVVMACDRADNGENTKVNMHPNIVLIVADDLGYGDLSYNGATKISTPAIDSLAEDGMIFKNAHVVSSLCSPSRYSIMTGRYAWRTRLKYGVIKYYEKPLIEDDRTTMASMFKRNGYRTACVGKWHLGLGWPVNEKAPENAEETIFNTWEDNLHQYVDFTQPIKDGPIDKGFDYFYGMAGSNNMQPYVHIENDHVVEPPSVEQKSYDHYKNAPRAPNWHINTINQEFTYKAVDVINDHFANYKDKSLFLYFPTSAIHRPCLPTFTKGQSKAGLRGDIVEELDWTVSQIVKALKKNGAYENTLLVFTSDNGPRPGDPALWLNRYAEGDYEDFQQPYFNKYDPQYVNENGNEIWKAGWLTYGHDAAGNLLGFKSDAWQGGLQVPFIAHWPGKIKPGQINNNYINNTDLLATFAEVVGDTLKAEEAQDSYSFLSNLLDNGASQVRNTMVMTGGASGAFVVIKDGWKYIEAAQPGRWPETFYPGGPSNLDAQLYNLVEDPMEQNNLYQQKSMKVAELVDELNKVIAKSGGEGKKI